MASHPKKRPQVVKGKAPDGLIESGQNPLLSVSFEACLCEGRMFRDFINKPRVCCGTTWTVGANWESRTPKGVREEDGYSSPGCFS